jgi:glucosamine--fructose-6-phosphate aminotransferase (isomerizing)
MLVAISRSGTTSETIWALEEFRKTIGGPTMVVTCHPDSGLAQQADFVLAAPDAQELSIAQTRSFTSMLLLCQGLVSEMALDPAIWNQTQRLPGVLEEIVIKAGNLPHQYGENLDIEHMVFLGGGPLYGLANEAMLKTKEISLTYSEAYHPLELRHGPMSMVKNNTLVVGLLTDTGLSEQYLVLKDMQKLGAATLVLLENAASVNGEESYPIIEMHSGINEWLRGPLYLPILQRIAYHRAKAKGLNPDCPTNLTAVVKLEKNPEGVQES